MEIPDVIQECLDKIKALQEQIKELEKEIDAYSDGYIYIVHHTFMGIPSLNFLNNRYSAEELCKMDFMDEEKDILYTNNPKVANIFDNTIVKYIHAFEDFEKDTELRLPEEYYDYKNNFKTI